MDVRALGLATMFAIVAQAWTPTEAHACGGTWCDSNQAPVDQTGEVILFNVADGFVEAHIRIEYDGGDALQFAWIVPVLAVPEVDVGSFRFIQTALDASVPIYGTSLANTCEDDPTDTVGFIQDPDGGGGTGPEIIAEDTAGAFDYVILQGGDAASVGQWLADNGYSPDDEAPEILQAYIDEGHVFVAFKLRHGVGVEDIHPIVLRYAGDEPCIPIRLTRIAAQDDMDIRALFLGDARVMPLNYRHVRLNRVRLDWLGNGANYRDLVAMAVDEPEADGRAFVTEYAGTSAIIDDTSLATNGFDPSAFSLIPATQVVDALATQGLASCTKDACIWSHELVPSLLHEFVPVPDGVDESAFYACLDCYADQIDVDAWNGTAFAAAFVERIIEPMDHARDLLATWPYLTRLYTRISPHEMINDPTFAEQDGLEDEPNRLGAERQVGCCGTVVRLPGGRTIAIDDDSFVWPSWPEEMPWAERVEQSQPSGPPATLVDRTAEIDALVDAHNAGYACDADTTGGTATTSEGGDEAPDPTSVGGTTTASSSESGSETGNQSAADASTSGCGCDTRGRGSPLAMLALALLRRRRRR